MKRVNNSDINFKLSPKLVNLNNFTIRFYTVNLEQFFIRKTQDDVKTVENENECGETEVDYYLKLDWSDLVTLGEGVLQYNLTNNFEDSDRPDNYFNQNIERTTQYYIDSNVIVDEDEAESYAEIIAELGNKIDGEITRSTSADTLQAEALNTEIQTRQDQINNILDIIDSISGETDLSNYYTKDETYNRNEVDAKIEDIDVSEQLKDYLKISSFTESEQVLSGAIDTNKSDIATLANQISNEVTNRSNADIELTNKINAKLDISAYTPTDLTNYYTKSEVYNKSEIDNKGYITDISGKLNISDFNAYSANTKTSIDGKQDELISATNIKTINNQSLLGSGNITIEGGGFIKVTNPDTAVTKVGLVNSLSQHYDTNIGNGAVIEGDGDTNRSIIASGKYSHAEGYSTSATSEGSHAEGSYTTASGYTSHAEGLRTIASGDYSHAEGQSTKASGNHSHAEGQSTKASGIYSHAEGQETKASGNNSHAEGQSTKASGINSHAEGYLTITNNQSEHGSGQYNISNKASTTFGDSGNTLFSVGNGTSTSNKHNAFEIRQNGDIYITSGSTDIKLQDHLGSGGGSSYTAGDGIDITNDVISVTGKQDTLISGTNIKTINNESLLGSGNISIQGGVVIDPSLDSGSTNPVANSAITQALSGKQDTLSAGTGIEISGNVISATGGGGSVDQTVISGSTNAVSGGAVYSQLGGMKIVKLTESEYTALVTKDDDTLYCVVPNS